MGSPFKHYLNRGYFLRKTVYTPLDQIEKFDPDFYKQVVKEICAESGHEKTTFSQDNFYEKAVELENINVTGRKRKGPTSVEFESPETNGEEPRSPTPLIAPDDEYEDSAATVSAVAVAEEESMSHVHEHMLQNQFNSTGQNVTNTIGQ